MTYEADDHDAKDLLTKTKPTSAAEASAPTGDDLREMTNSGKGYNCDAYEQLHIADAFADESPSATQAPQNVFEAANYATSLKTLLDSLTLVTDPLAESRSKGPIDLECIGFTPPKRVCTGIPSREVQNFEFERLDSSPTAGYDPRATKDGQTRTAWMIPSPSTNVYEIPSDQHLRGASSQSSESAEKPVNRYHSNINYKFILWCVIAIKFPYQIMVALALAGVFGSHESLIASLFLYSFVVAAVFGMVIGVCQRMKEIKREGRMGS